MTTPARVSIPAALRRTMTEHAKRESPRECCGLLVGRPGRVTAVLPMANADPKPRTGFRVDPADHIAARRALRQLAPALEIVGVYHSHPAGPAVPSPRDLREAHYPEWLFVIVGSAGRSVQAFRIARGRATRVRLRWTLPRARPRPRTSRGVSSGVS